MAMEGRGAFATWQWESAWVPFGVLFELDRPAGRVGPRRVLASTGLPLAVQLVGAPHGERTLLSTGGPDRGRALVATPPPIARSIASVPHRMAVCRICSGELELRVRGNGGAITAAAFSPSAHVPGQHGDLLRCRECATVQQPILPSGEPLHDLYREMRDDEYLAEEAGRRATAGRLLDLIGAHVPRGRLLDVGCGHGLLLDEARTRGYETRGARALARGGAARARDARPRRARGAAGGVRRGPQRRLARRLRRGRARRRDRAPRRSGRRDRRSARRCCGPAACSASSRPTRPRSTARAGRRALVGLPARRTPSCSRAGPCAS